MKSMFILSITFLLAKTGNAQTAAEIRAQQQWILAHASEYVGKPFSTFYNALTIKPKSVWAGISHKNMYVEPEHTFYYVDVHNYKDSADFFYIEWKDAISETEAKKYQKKQYRNFNSQEYPVYSQKIIEKIKVWPDPFYDPSTGEYSRKNDKQPVIKNKHQMDL